MRWTVAEFQASCGSCGATILPDEPLALMTTHGKIRCERCAGPVDADAVDAARHKREADDLARPFEQHLADVMRDRARVDGE